MIEGESWYREAVRPIRIDESEVQKVVSTLIEEFEEALDTYYSNPMKPLKGNDYFWAATWGPRIKVENVKGEAANIPVNFFIEPSDGTFGIGGWLSLTQPKVLAIVMPLGGVPAGVVKNFWETEKETLRREIYSVVIHELTHAKDIIPQVTYDNPRGKAQVDFDAYYNDPAEVRAFMQQVAHEVAEIYEAPPAGTNPSQHLMETLEKSRTWKRVTPYLRPENRRKFLQGVVNYLIDQEPET